MKEMHRAPVDFIVSGGGARNLTLMQMLRKQLEPQGCTVQASDDLGLPDRFDVYYGMADDRIGVARMDVPESLPHADRELKPQDALERENAGAGG